MVYSIKLLISTNYSLHAELCWRHKVKLEVGIRRVYEWYREFYEEESTRGKLK